MFRVAISLLFAVGISGCSVLPESRASAGPDARQTQRALPSSPQGRQCLASLGRSGTQFQALPDKYYGAGCSTLNSVQLTSLQGDSGQFTLASAGPVTCPTANAMAAWARYGVDRAARQLLGSPLQRIETMGTYACRNVAGSGRRSAHARADAVDVAAFVLADGRRIAVAQDWSGGSATEQEFLRVVHRSACRRFGTVLGPNYNAAHRDHFHLEGGGDSSFCR